MRKQAPIFYRLRATQYRLRERALEIKTGKGARGPRSYLAERVGFEPTVPRKGDNRFRVCPDRPLWHLSCRVLFYMELKPASEDAMKLHLSSASTAVFFLLRITV